MYINTIMKETLQKIKLREVAQLKKRIKELRTIKEDKQADWNYDNPWEEYEKLTEVEDRELSKLNRRLRLIMPYELSDIPEHGDVMTLNEFKNACKNGGFIDYDGYGKYVVDDKMTNVYIYPSDVINKSIRYELNKVIWFNR